jgi:hypothetical protein
MDASLNFFFKFLHHESGVDKVQVCADGGGVGVGQVHLLSFRGMKVHHFTNLGNESAHHFTNFGEEKCTIGKFGEEKYTRCQGKQVHQFE